MPGPGQYPLDSTLKGPRFGFGTDKRHKPAKDSSPGPGAYKVPTKIADVPKYVIPNQKEEHKFV